MPRKMTESTRNSGAVMYFSTPRPQETISTFKASTAYLQRRFHRNVSPRRPFRNPRISRNVLLYLELIFAV